MKKILYYLVFTALSFPYATYAIGLGSIDVHSYLNQPFYADIQLIDVGDTPLSGIQASIASPEDFKRAGLDREHMLDELIFKIEKKEGKPFIIVRSIDPISEPYLELLIDLSWANGQIYRAYTVLLDPPAYQLAGKSKKPTSAKTQYSSKNNRVPGTIDKDVVKDKLPEMPDAERRGAVTYGPTLASETIWQIAQRYKTKDVSLQQIILAIAGENPDAFKTGNINGLKKGVELKIPPTDIIRQIPAELAKQEVYEHDSAWQKKEPINHVLKPPYYEGDTADDNKTNDTGAATGKISYPSKLPSASHATAPGITSGDTSFFSPFIPKVTSFLSAGQDVPSQPSKTKVTQSTSNKQQDLIKAEMSIATAAINSVREANILLSEQVRYLQAENKRLQEQNIKREKELDTLKAQMKNLTVRQGLAGQASSPQEYETPAIWPWILFLLLLIGGGVFVYWWVWMRHGSDDDKAEAEMERVEDENKFQDMKEPTKPQTPGVIVSESKIKRGQVVESEKTEGGDLETDQKSEADQEIESQEIESKETSGFNDEEESRSAVPVESQDIEPEETQDNVPKETQPVVPTADQNAELQKADSDTNEFQTQEKTQEENLNKDLEVSKQSLDEKNKAAKPADLQESKTSTQKKSKPSDSKKASPLGESEKEKSEKSEKSEQNKQESTEHLIDFEPVPIPPADTASDGKPEDNDHKKPEQTEDENMIEFEAPVFDSDEESKKSNEQKSEEEPEKQTVPEKNNKKKADKQDDKKETDINGAESDLEEAKPIKSTHALETLLDLAQTYISMEDYEAAKQSLEEVLEHGNKQQQKEARDLLDKLANS